MAQTVSQAFLETVRRWPDRPALRVRDGERFRSIPYRELHERVQALGTALIDLGLRPGDTLGLIADNRPEWILCDLSCVCIGVPDVPRGSDSTAKEIEYILGHADTVGAFVEDARQLAKVLAFRTRLPRLRFLVVMDPAWAGPAPEGVLRLEELCGRGRTLVAGGDRRFAEAAGRVGPDDLATIIYTSGTTGEPKGVMLAHRNIMQNIETVPPLLDMSHEDRFLSILPPWHVFERIVEYACVSIGASQSYTGIRTLGADMVLEQPTLMASVPRIWEGIHGRVMATLAKEPAAKQRIFHLLLGVSKRFVLARKVLQGKDALFHRPSAPARAAQLLGALATVLLLLPVYLFAQKKFAPIRARTGGRLRAAVSGGGALPPYVDHFFAAIGVTLCEGYGLTETSPVLNVRDFAHLVLGTVGPPIPGTEVRIVDEQGRDVPPGEKGVILCRGRQVMVGYHKRPEETARVLSADGWFNTGDLGRLTVRGELAITGRAKETIVLSGGENVEPTPIEDAVTESPYIAQVMVVGQDRKHIGALVVPALDAVREWLRSQGVAEEMIGDAEAVCGREETHTLIRDEIRRLVTEEKGFKYYEKIPRFRLLPREFAVGDELTHTMKKRRNVIAERYADQIEGLFR
jgi:long-chain acyl-CoA synthetase